MMAGTLRQACSIVLAALCAALGGCCSTPSMSTAANFGPATPFPGPADFLGAYAPRAADAANGLQSTYSGFAVLTMMDRSVVEKALPAGVRLAATSTGSVQHPVIHLVGDQREPSAVYAGVATQIPTASDYREMILLVPFAIHDSGTQWHNHAVRMYLDDISAVAGGNSVYGYAKKWARVNEAGTPPSTTNQVTDLLGATYFLSDVRLAGPWIPAATAAASMPRWKDLQTIFEMPVLGLNAPNFICSYWEWDFANAQVAPATSSFQFFRAFIPGMQDWVDLGALSSAPDGAVAMSRVRWRLGPPLASCRF